ncbi:uncharacterized protein LOC122026276 isoform X2 [Zingiber officinale]|uniref:uncharacterized protein LOC122026276 isoform X2 n=1 Tax=Zingiber officinale TaxID=94328 RepID=UPI001C4DB36B|nr:uncharacterized protein LOC122026276 isoform X2 [Zingiber officinale]
MYAALIRGLGFIDSCCKLRHSTRRAAVYCFWIGAPVSVGDRLVMNDNNRRSSSYIVSDLLQGGDDGREKIMTIPRKEKKRKTRREEKAEKVAALDMVFRRCTGCLEDAHVEKI